MTTVLTTRAFVRVRFTWLTYFMLGYYTYMASTLGPLLPFLRSELKLSYSLAGLHISAFALGMILSGSVGDRLAQKWGRAFVFWGGGAGLALGALGVAWGSQVALTIGGALIMGVCGSLLLMMIQATLADRYGEQRTIALTEANVIASICATLAPMLIGGFQSIGLGWRGGLFVAVIAFSLLFLWFRQEAIPNQPAPVTRLAHQSAALPRSFWAYWIVLYLGVAVEWCMVSWGADFLVYSGLDSANAAMMVSLFFLAMVVGRMAGSYLARSIPSPTLLLAAIGITLAGFPLFWLAPVVWLSLIGLFITGLGTANLFPLTLSVAVGTAPNQADLANARVLLGIGLAIISVPLVLGWLADQLNIQNAYGIVGVILIMAMIITFSTNRAVATARLTTTADG